MVKRITLLPIKLQAEFLNRNSQLGFYVRVGRTAPSQIWDYDFLAPSCGSRHLFRSLLLITPILQPLSSQARLRQQCTCILSCCARLQASSVLVKRPMLKCGVWPDLVSGIQEVWQASTETTVGRARICRKLCQLQGSQKGHEENFSDSGTLLTFQQLIKQLSATPTLLPQNATIFASETLDPQAALQANKATFFFRLVPHPPRLSIKCRFLKYSPGTRA